MKTLHLCTEQHMKNTGLSTKPFYSSAPINEQDFTEIANSMGHSQILNSPDLDSFPPFDSDDSCNSIPVQYSDYSRTKNQSSEPKSIFKPKPHLNYIVTSSTGDHNLKDAVIFGTQINMINAIKIRQDNTGVNVLDDEFSVSKTLPALPLPCNVYETITIRINTDIKKDYIKRKCVEDNGGYYYDFEQQILEDLPNKNEDEEEYAVIKAEFIGLLDLQEQKSCEQTGAIKKAVRFK